ncbi:sugar phosphate nucleotidyltransferase [Halobellus rufus]|uniref:sugar phosphate nucleotidyltransferase n=1 Tax=Halobellus rufus TaxID=1448860 RepID=UPI0006798D1C|nr:sugar phosphate nucleotidyltransferase [Halobellus rufus]
MKAVVLAAGKGRRLWPLTENRPKPMIPVANRPILEHVIDALDGAAVDEVILVVGSNRERIQNYFQDGQDWELDISYVVQEQQLGTGHALLQAEAQIGDSFIAMNGDRIIDAALIERVWDRHQETGDPVLSVTRVEEPSRYGVVELDGEMVSSLEEKPLPQLTTSEYINTGVYAFEPDIFAAIRQTEGTGEQALTDTLTRYIDDQRLRAVTYRGMWLDVSEPWDLLEMNDSLIAYEGPSGTDPARVDDSAVVAEAAIVGEGVSVHPQAAVLRGVTLGDNVSVGPGVVLENAVILSDVTLKAGAVVTDCIVGANTTIGPNTTVEGGSTDVVLNERVYHDVTFGGLLGDNVDVGGNVTITPGSIVGNDAHIGSAALVSGRIDDSTHVERG